MPPAPRRDGGIRKRQQQRRDRDGDLVMGATPRVTAARPTRPGTKPAASTRQLTELRVTGWTDDAEIPKIVKFLERHASKRSASAKAGGAAASLIKRSRCVEKALIISVRPEDAPVFGKINGFSFASSQGGQKLSITGPGIRNRSPTESTDPAASSATKDTMDLLTGFLDRRYDPSTKLLNLSNRSEERRVGKECPV